MKLDACGACGGTDLEPVLDLDASPLADEFPTTPDASRAAKRWPLRLVRCFACTLVQLDEVVPDDVLWRGDYGFYTGASADVAAEQATYAADLMARHPGLCAEGVVEIACNDGTMLQHFRNAGYRTLGVDPAAGPAVAARASGMDVWIEPFTTDVAQRIVAEHGPAGLVVANHVIAHATDLHDFIAGIRVLIGDTGAAVVEFQYLVDLLLGNQFDHVYHEHRRFLTLTSLQNALDPHGLHVTDVAQMPRQGGSLRCTIRGAAHAADRAVARLLWDEAWLREPRTLDGLQGRADRIRARLRDLLLDASREGQRVAGYGASAKATTLLTWCAVDVDLVQYVVDTTPTKHGRYMPGTGIPIINPSADSRAPDVYLLLVHNYLASVLRREQSFSARGGRWIVPVPQPVVL